MEARGAGKPWGARGEGAFSFACCCQVAAVLMWDGAQPARCSCVPRCPGGEQLPMPTGPRSLFSPGGAERRGAPRCSYTPLWEEQ